KNLTETPEAGQSLERRTTSFPALSAAQWKTCALSNGASPGDANSGEKNAGFQIQLRQNSIRILSQSANDEVAGLAADQDGSLKTEIFQLNGRAVLPAPRVLSVTGGESLTLPLSYFAESLQKFRGNLVFQFTFSPSRGPGETKRYVFEVRD
ncbi:MAG: hypothetical protein JNM63_13895, partial [Spirochaetia bacterium]|nr:hypothetical protein [Spirochaetia bacterium]